MTLHDMKRDHATALQGVQMLCDCGKVVWSPGTCYCRDCEVRELTVTIAEVSVSSLSDCPVAKSKVRLGPIIGFGVLLPKADIGEYTEEDGTRGYMTWGRNLTPKQAEGYLGSRYLPIKTGSHNGEAFYELVLNSEEAEQLLYRE